MARKKIREYDSKRLLKEHFKRLSGNELPIKSAQVIRKEWEEWFGCLKSGFGSSCFFCERASRKREFYLNIVSERLGDSMSFSECGGIEIEENWEKVKTIFVPTGVSLTPEIIAPLVATLPLEIRREIEEFMNVVFAIFQDLDFTFLEMNPFTLVNGKPYPLDMRGELDDTAGFKNFKKWGHVEFPLPFGRVMSPTETFIHGLDAKTSASLKFSVEPQRTNLDNGCWRRCKYLGFASELGNYAEYSGAPKEDEVLQYARVVIDCATADPDGRKRALVIGGGIANFTDVAATFNGIGSSIEGEGVKT
ncbi:ATP-citrate synthase alpha chain protein [Quillaja saponaria]|uniref:ATP citrate synthase n=1 Tax=Quillaja saponaria TaxID=32244 RepID=A0AAD7KPL8_QUISA|nr:ATP-citrate synthase alpha chain protein [Quillaja saponaria]